MTKTINTKDIGSELDREFGEDKINDDKEGNFHINRFFCHVRMKVTDQDLSQLKIVDVLREIDPEGDWKKVEPSENWTGLFYGQHKRSHRQDETERQREQRLSEVRKELMARLRKELATHSRGVNDTTEHGVYVMITRACLYTPEDMDTN